MSSEVESLVISEHQIDIFLNEDNIKSLVCSNEYLPYLVLGHMISEGISEGTEDIESISICKDGRQARVLANLKTTVDLQSCRLSNKSLRKTARPMKKLIGLQ